MTYSDIYNMEGSKDCNSWMCSKKKIFFAFISIIVLIIIVVTVVYKMKKKQKDIEFNDNMDYIETKLTNLQTELENKSISDSNQNTQSEIIETKNTEESNTPMGIAEAKNTAFNPFNVVVNAEESNSTMGIAETSGFKNLEPFTNDLPYELKGTQLSLNPDLDYNDFLQNMSLDQDVIKQHQQYVNDRNKITSTASFAPSRSDNQDIVTTWGLSKPNYIKVDPSARNVPSQDPEQGSKPVRLQWK